MDLCNDCGGKDVKLYPEQGEIMCSDCGIVVEESMLVYDGIGEGYHGLRPESRSAGTGVMPEGSRVRRGWLESHKEKHNMRAWQCISRVTDHTHLPEQVRKEAMRVYRRVADKDLCKGRTLKPIVLACVYIACKTHKCPRKAEDIAMWGMSDKKDILRDYKMIKKNMDISIPQEDPLDYILEYGYLFGDDDRPRKYASDLYKKVEQKGMVSGKKPKAIASAVIYITAKVHQIPISQKKLSKMTGLVELTIRKRVKEMATKLTNKKISQALGGSQ